MNSKQESNTTFGRFPQNWTIEIVLQQSIETDSDFTLNHSSFCNFKD